MYLVTGATGFLGGNLVNLLAAQGCAVRALVRAGNPAAQKLPSDVTLCTGDLLDEASLDRFFEAGEGVEMVVLHCASIVALSPEPDQQVYDANVTGTQNIVDRCVRYHARKLVYVSSTSVIPEKPHGEEIVETDHLAPEHVVGYYAKTKAMATQLVLDAVREQGMDASVVFPSGIFGPGDVSRGLLTRFLSMAYRRQIPCGVRGTFNAVDVRDLAQGIVDCAARGRPGEGYIMSNDVVNMRMIFDAVSACADVPRVRVMLPIGVARAAAAIAEALAKLVGKKTVLTRFLIYNLERNNAFSCEKAKADLGFCTRPFAQTIADTLDWLVETDRTLAASKHC